MIQDSASSAVLAALVAARERATNGKANASGVPQGLRVYASAQAHSSIEKAVRVAGLGSASLRLVDVDTAYAMNPAALDAAIAEDVANGNTPCFVVATVGSTSSLALDPLWAIGEVCRRHGAWLHVDAAMAGTAALCPELRFIHDGLEHADSYCFNPHKWMLVNFDCSCLYVADRNALVQAMSIIPEYLRNPATSSGDVIDYRDWHIPLGRRFRALKLWFVLRHYGASGLRQIVREHVRLAHLLAANIADDPDFSLAAPVPLNLVCFRHRGGDELNERLLERLNASGDLYLSHTRLGGRYTLRLAIGQWATRERHVVTAWEAVKAEAAALVTPDLR